LARACFFRDSPHFSSIEQTIEVIFMSKNEQNPQTEQEHHVDVEHAVEVMPSLEEMLQEAERKAQEHYDAWMYAKAESENIRRRAHEDTEKARKFALEKFSSELLAVKDSLEAALAVESATLESYKNGVELTLKQLSSVFEKFNVAEVHPAGEKFDPHKHQAISMVEAAEAEPNTVVQVHDRVLRPALVMVAKPRA
jgi:molecular chaperone GrpE